MSSHGLLGVSDAGAFLARLTRLDPAAPVRLRSSGGRTAIWAKDLAGGEPHRDLVCPVHLGLMQGALTELRAPVTVTALTPFAEPTACLAHLAPGPDHDVSPS